MNSIPKGTTRIHQRLLIASYVLGSISTLLGALAAIGATVDQGRLEYPSINGPVPPTPTKTNHGARSYFDQ